MSEAYAQLVWDIAENALFVKTAAGTLAPLSSGLYDNPRIQKRLFPDDMPVAFWCYVVEYRVQSWMVGVNNGAPTWGKWNIVIRPTNNFARFRRRRAAEAFLRNLKKSPGHEYRIQPQYLGKSWHDHLRPVLRARREQQHARRVQKLRDEGKFAEANEVIQKWEAVQTWQTPTSSLVAYYNTSLLGTLKANTPFKSGALGPIHPKVLKNLQDLQDDWIAQGSAAAMAAAVDEAKKVVTTFTETMPPVTTLMENAIKVSVDQMAKSIEKEWAGWQGLAKGKMPSSVHDEYIVELPDKT